MSKEKPESVDANAWWSSSDNEWVLGEKDSEGKFHGLVTYWRPDGTLVNHCDFEHGTPHGKYKRYHQSGEVSRQGVFAQGTLHGTDVFTRSDQRTTENFPSGLHETVWRAQMDMVNGSMKSGRLFNRNGEQVGEDGELCPDRPKGVPSEAIYSSTSGRWVFGNTNESYEREGIWRFYTQEGWVSQETLYVAGDSKEDTLYHNQIESDAAILLREKKYEECERVVEKGLSELDDDVDRLVVSWIRVRCLSEKGNLERAVELAIDVLKEFPIGMHWGRFMTQGQRGYNTTAQIQAFLATSHIAADRGEEALQSIRDAIDNTTQRQVEFYIIKAAAFRLLKREDEEFASIKSALCIDSGIEELQSYKDDPRFSEWLKAIDPESMTVEGAWEILGEGGEKLTQYQGVLVLDDEDQEEREAKEQRTERVVFDPETMNLCIDCAWDTSTLPENNSELSVFAKLADRLDVHSYNGEYVSVGESTLTAAVQTVDGNWLARIQSIFLPVSLVNIETESMRVASWQTTEHRTSRIYYIHQDEQEFFHDKESISAMVVRCLELDDDDYDTTISSEVKSQWVKAGSLTEEHRPFFPHLELLELEPRTHWIVNLLVGKNPDIVSEIYLGEGIMTAASPDDWKREKELLAWPHLQAYWIFHHAVFGCEKDLREVLSHVNRSYPGASELAIFAERILAGEEIKEVFWNPDRVLEYRMEAMDKRSELLSEETKARVLEENKGTFEADAKMKAALQTLAENPINEKLISFLEGLESFAGKLDGIQEALAQNMDKPMDYYMAMKKGRVTPLTEVYHRFDVIPERILEVPERKEPLLRLIEAAVARGETSPDDHPNTLPGALYALGLLTIEDATGFDSFFSRVQKMAFCPDKFGRFRRLQLAMLAAKYIETSDTAKSFLQQEAARYAEQSEGWQSDTFGYAEQALGDTGDEDQIKALNGRLCGASFSGANWSESVAICQRFLDNPSPLMSEGLKSAVEKGLGRHDDGQRAIVIRSYAKCTGLEARSVLLNWLSNIKDVRTECETAALLAGLIEVDVGTDALPETLNRVREVLTTLKSGSMKVGAAASLVKTIYEHEIPGFAGKAKLVNKYAQDEKYVEDHLKEWLTEHVGMFK